MVAGLSVRLAARWPRPGWFRFGDIPGPVFPPVARWAGYILLPCRPCGAGLRAFLFTRNLRAICRRTAVRAGRPIFRGFRDPRYVIFSHAPSVPFARSVPFFHIAVFFPRIFSRRLRAYSRISRHIGIVSFSTHSGVSMPPTKWYPKCDIFVTPAPLIRSAC